MKKILRYLKRDLVDLGMFIVTIGLGVYSLITDNTIGTVFLVIALYVFGVMHRMGIITDMIKIQEDEERS